MKSVSTVSSIEFDIRQWAAWAPGIETHEQWRSWAEAPFVPSGDQVPDVSGIPAMQRRRLNRLTRMAFHVVDCIDHAAELPQIYCSRHGDLLRSTELLQQIAQQEPLSSMNLGLSVHNAVAGNISILQNNTQPMTSVAAGVDGIACAMIEAVMQSADTKQDVILLVYDETVPELYEFATSGDSSVAFAFALRIAQGQDYTLSWPADWAANQDKERSVSLSVEAYLPMELQFLAWFLSRRNHSWTQMGGKDMSWQWSKNK